MSGDDWDGAQVSARLVQKPTLKVYPGLSHGMRATHPEIINPALLAFIQA